MKKIKATLSKILGIKKGFRTMRFMYASALPVAAFMVAAVALTDVTASYVRLETSATTIEAGSRFTVDVYAYAHVPVNAVDITLKFDGSKVEVEEVDRGQSVLTIWTQDPIVEKNQVILRGGTFRKGFLKEHKIASIDLLAKKGGQSSFSATDVVLLAGDGTGAVVATADVIDSKVNLFVYDDNTSPDSIGVKVGVNIVTDIDGDGQVTLKDISAFMAAWQSRTILYDFNGDGKMSFRDFSIILANFFF